MSDSEEKKPVENVLAGASIFPFDEDLAFDSAFILARLIDGDGVVQWSYRSTSPINMEELLGVLTVQVEVLKAKLARQWDED
jgi:hypothetical protein